MFKNKKIFSLKIDEKHIDCRLFGIKFSIKCKHYDNNLKDTTRISMAIQDKYNLEPLRNSSILILFLVPEKRIVNGGVMSVFSLCATSRELNSESLCLISTPPNSKYTYAYNDNFLNNEQVYRFSQIIENCTQLRELILHIPDYYVKYFYKNLKKKDINFLKSIEKLHINVLNQNIQYMPKQKYIKSLYKLTDNITQTVAHDRYATQEVCNEWNIPTHLFSALWDMSMYKVRTFEEKEKIIVLSPDEHKNKDEIVNKLKQELPEWKIITVQNLTFAQYMDLVSKAYFTITFGEGFDGYFMQPPIVSSIGISVYNDVFFPDESWMEFDNVFESYDSMYKNITGFIKEYSQDSAKYTELSKQNKKKLDKIYNFEQYKDNLKRFYEKKYDYLPQKENKR